MTDISQAMLKYMRLQRDAEEMEAGFKNGDRKKILTYAIYSIRDIKNEQTARVLTAILVNAILDDTDDILDGLSEDDKKFAKDMLEGED